MEKGEVKAVEVRLTKEDLALSVKEFIERIMAPAIGNLGLSIGFDISTKLQSEPVFCEPGAELYLVVEGQIHRTIQEMADDVGCGDEVRKLLAGQQAQS